MINLNNFNKPIISREILKKELFDYQIYQKYIKHPFKINEVFSSPFREDNIPSFGIFKNSKGELIYNDFVLGGGDAFCFVKYLYGFNTWWEVYSRIAIDFNLDDKYHCKSDMTDNTLNRSKLEYYEQPKIQSDNIKINVRIRKWKYRDIKYWKQYGITEKTLNKYNVFPIDYIFLKTKTKNKTIKADSLAYVYIENKDGYRTYKIYQPYSKYKWISTHDFSVWQGWKQLPSYDEFLIITKSLKDVMCLHDVMKVPSTALQNEKALPKKQVMNQLKKRFNKNIFLLYDNDFDKDYNWGQIFAKNFCNQYNVRNIFIPSEYKCKDFSDLVKKVGKSKASNILEELLITESVMELPFDDIDEDEVPF